MAKKTLETEKIKDTINTRIKLKRMLANLTATPTAVTPPKQPPSCDILTMIRNKNQGLGDTK
jgi:hypothetical protein